MTACYRDGDFGKYFRENMAGLGLPVPATLFDNFNAAVANATLMANTLSTLGAGATVGEVIGATVALEKLGVVAGLGASYYLGAVVGSIAVASGRSLGCGRSLADVLIFLSQHQLAYSGVRTHLLQNPEILDPSRSGRFAYASKALSRHGAAA
ncbi:MAG: hypothetical protein CMN28_15740 [Salinisphaeraceae bacterium]|nr:hypothetical protein [Salinisphaeraceae bacterium]